MTFGEYSQVVYKDYTFHEVVNSACEKLMEYQIKISLRRLNEMDKVLSELERELDEFLESKSRFSKKTRN